MSLPPSLKPFGFLISVGGRGALPPGLCINIAGEAVEIRSQMKCLGLIIDSQWPFGQYFELLASKVAAAANALCGMLPNIGGVGVECANCTRGLSNLGSCMEPDIKFVYQRDISVFKQLTLIFCDNYPHYRLVVVHCESK